MENKVKHLEMINGIINRLGSDSFKLKGWSVTLAAGIFALSSKDSKYVFFLVVYVPLIVFWILDTYYLQLERKYRNLYDKVRQLEEKDIDFSMNLTKDLFTEKTRFFRCFFSVSEIIFYLPTAALVWGIIYLMSK